MPNAKQDFKFLLFMLSIFVTSSLIFLDEFFQVSTNQIAKTRKQYLDDIYPNELDEHILQPASLKYDQIILLIIDAWRADYPNATNMPFLHEHECNHLRVKVHIPTVTMPRIKSLTTGTISNFIDIVLNLGHAAIVDESILHRLVEKNKKSVFAGDRTWIQLFPNMFRRAVVNTDSFFVNDFYEGDLNVTKALEEELTKSDWNLMILHYLGLDHIGHVEGSHSDKIYSKLFEMDNTVKYVEANINSRNLLLLTGDHGMRNGGSHGGSEMEELYVPLITLQKQCDRKKRSYGEYNQIDISSTLAVLLDVKIPHSSIGCLIPELLECFSKEEQLYLFYYNSLHLFRKLKSRFHLSGIENEDYFRWYEDAKASHKEFISSPEPSTFLYEEAKHNYVRLCKKISKLLSESLVQYCMPRIFIALSLTTLCAIKLLISVVFQIVDTSIETNRFLWKHFFKCMALAICINIFAHSYNYLNTHSLNRLFIITCCVALSIYFAFDVIKLLFTVIMPPLQNRRKVKLRLSCPSVILGLFSLRTLSLASSSFIEEEHQVWYYLTPSVLAFLFLKNFYNDIKIVWSNHKPFTTLMKEFWNFRFVFIVMMSLIGGRRLNQTGNKWHNITDIGDVLARNENHSYLSLTLLIGLVLLFFQFPKHNSLLERIFCFISLTCVFLYRQMVQHSFWPVLLFWCSLLCIQFIQCRHIFYRRKSFTSDAEARLAEFIRANLSCSFLISALLHRPHNVILLPVLMYTLEKSYHLCDSLYIKNKQVYSRSYMLIFKTVMTIFVANMFYFFQGNSNSLATIDLNPGYIGLSSYHPFIVGLLITLNTCCANINSFLYLMWHMFSRQRNDPPLRQEKLQFSNILLMESTEEDFCLVYNLFIISTVMPATVFWYILAGFRSHLFIYSVFAPKAFYECFHLLVFYINFIITNLYFRLFLK